MMSSTPSRTDIKIESKSLTPNHGQLTGVPRKIKDGVADLHNCVQKWETLKNKGFNIATNIANLKIEKRVVVDSMQLLLTKMNTVNELFEKVARLSSVSSYAVFFNSWTPRAFARSSNVLTEMYQDEMKAKLAIVESIAHVDVIRGYFTGLRSPDSARDILMTYVAAWLHEPYINEGLRDVVLDEMLLETGHRQ